MIDHRASNLNLNKFFSAYNMVIIVYNIFSYFVSKTRLHSIEFDAWVCWYIINFRYWIFGILEIILFT